ELDWEQTIDTDGERENFPGQIKKQECVYKIVESDDGELVIAGNTSHNHDDNYLVGIYEDCENKDFGLHWPDYYSAAWQYSSTTGAHELQSNLTWSGSTHHIKGTMVIPNGKKLILDNCTIQFADGKRLGYET